MNRFSGLALIAAVVGIAASAAQADVQSVMRTDQQWVCTAPDGTVVSKGTRDDLVFAACANAVNATKQAYKVTGASFDVRYVQPAAPVVTPAPTPVPVTTPVSTPAPAPTPAPAAKFTGLTPICSDAGSIGQQSCQVPPTHFDFPSASSIVKSDGTWLVFGSLAAAANVLVCSVEQLPGAIADPYRDLCGVDTYTAKSAVRLSAAAVIIPSAPASPAPVSTPPVTGSAMVSWTAPTTNTDGSPLTDLSGFEVLYGAASPPTIVRDIPGAVVTSYTVTGLPSGTWYFAVRAKTSTGAVSALSSILNKQF